MGKTIKNFKQEMKDGMGDDKKPATPSVCPKCGAPVLDPDSSFCPKCGQKL
jgi:rubrerythrin